MSDPDVTAALAHALLDFAVGQGADRAALLARSGIGAEVRGRQDVPAERYVALVRAAKEMVGNPALALHFGEYLDIGDVAVVGLLSQSCKAGMPPRDHSRFTVEVQFADTECLQLVRRDGMLWLVDAKGGERFPEMVETSFPERSRRKPSGPVPPRPMRTTVSSTIPRAGRSCSTRTGPADWTRWRSLPFSPIWCLPPATSS